MKQYLQDLVNHLSWLNINILCEIDAIDLPLSLDKAVPLGLITSELLSNSFKHAFAEEEKGSIEIVLEALKKDQIQLTISDSGKGYQSDFDPTKSDGLGMEIILTLSGQIGAKVNFIPQEKGAVSTVIFDADSFQTAD